MLLLCGDCYVNMPGLRYYPIHYREEFITGDQLHFPGGTSLESSERGKCSAGPVGGREMPWIRNQNTRCQRDSDAIKSNERVSERATMRAVRLACWPSAWKETWRVFSITGGRTQNSRIFCICLDCIEILRKEFAFHMDFVFSHLHSEMPAGMKRDCRLGIPPASSHFILVCLRFWICKTEGDPFFTKLLYYIRICMVTNGYKANSKGKCKN